MNIDQLTRCKAFIAGLPVLKALGWDTWIPFTHAWHESGAFSVLNDSGVVSEDRTAMLTGHNYWGIKKRKAWAGPVVRIATGEWMPHRADPNTYKSDPDFIKVLRLSDDKKLDRILVRADFMAFTGIDQALLWYDDFIKTSPNYCDAYAKRDNYLLFFKLLMNHDKPGEQSYATNPSYAAENEAAYRVLKSRPELVAMFAERGA